MLKKLFLFFSALLGAAMLIFFKDESVNGAVNGLYSCSDVLIPSLFPFMVCVNMIIKTANLLNIGNLRIPIIFFMSCTGGYPVGAAVLNSSVRDGFLDKEKAGKCLNFCVNPGPGFLIFAVGIHSFNSAAAGTALLASCFLSSLTIFTYYLLKDKTLLYGNSCRTENKILVSEMFVESTSSAASAMFSVCSFVVVFSVINAIILEISKKIKTLKILLILNEVTYSSFHIKNIYILSFVIGFGGFCVIMQIFSIGTDLKINKIKFFLFRIIHGFFSSFYTFIIFKLFNIPINTGVISNNVLIEINTPKTVAALSVFVLIFIISLQNVKKYGKK